MSDQEIEVNLSKVLVSILNKYKSVEISPEDLINDVEEDYRLRIDFNDETSMFEISLESGNES